MISFKIAIKPRYSDLDGTKFTIRLSDVRSYSTSPEEAQKCADQIANLSGVILANIKVELREYTYSLEENTIVMVHAFSNEKDYLGDHLKLRKHLFNNIVTRYNPLDVETGIREYTLRDHLF